mmetsp:Transcript_27010/g.25877  ORF Transcript_27010/g.25877 Transcript_27010/m.25877 type:complete len:380 (-) Transcript_27010:252-1391(-)|eukprot:CAMPEP_0197832046 /NCGR_PEP_ID=MMETSP1437-20131217/13024_1 /TAXON_ID=49252 ORGANISM="Eucampia antarctica, Strain CCMP1452" /NCGR_SAMPLE_ID=MMETSP1437 /ASSEMBLY_ACC=CAM_ASM_001096 /LENGTH=379 /DNA_ID=CAMNT_0043435215 /DNA_START=71 /DNA_END=1210 /DNA_ORIENTATION=+
MSASNTTYISSVVLTYWVVSISMVYLNKALMSGNLEAPLFVTWFQCIVTAVICWLAGKCGERAQRIRSAAYSKINQDDSMMLANNNSTTTSSPGENNNNTSSLSINGSSEPPKPSFFAQFPKAEYSFTVARKIFPLSIVFVGMISFNNLCLKWVEVSFYNVARALTIVFNVFFSRLLLGIPTSLRTMLCLSVVVMGFFIGSKGELNFSSRGTIAGVASSLFVSLNSIFTKKVLPAVDDNHWKLTWYNNINACFLFLPLIYYFEYDILKEHLDMELISGQFWSAMTIAGFFGFSIGIVTVLQIKATSPLSHNISGTAKAAVQSMMAFYIWGNEPTLLGVLGIFIVLGGSLLYTYVKMNENKMIAHSPPRRDVEMSQRSGA